MVDYLFMTMQKPIPEAQDSITKLFRRYEKDTTVISIVKSYLYDPNSPYRNEDLYLPFVQGLAESEFTPDSLREAYRRDAKMCALNPIGSKAPDFVFRSIKGVDKKMYDVPGQFTMLFFSNPGCTACKEIIEQIQSVDPLRMAIEDGRISIVNVYIDKDLKAWKEYSVNYPETWYNGYDPTYTLRSDQLYHIRAIPSLYLLDIEKRVVMKDAPTERAIMFLVNQLQ